MESIIIFNNISYYILFYLIMLTFIQLLYNLQGTDLISDKNNQMIYYLSN